jgi:hypothetical protein
MDEFVAGQPDPASGSFDIATQKKNLIDSEHI